MQDRGQQRVRPAWQSTALVIAVSLMVGFFVLPRLQPGASKLAGSVAPEFVLPIIHGGDSGSRLRLSELRGKTVILDFWASWCAACRAQVPILDEFSRGRRAQKVMVVGVNTGDEREHALRFIRERGFSYVSVFDERGQTAAAYQASTLPMMVVINAAGRITAVRRGVVSAGQLKQLTEEALAGESPTR